MPDIQRPLEPIEQEGNHSWGRGGLRAEGLEFLQGMAPKALRGAEAQKPKERAPSGGPARWT